MSEVPSSTVAFGVETILSSFSAEVFTSTQCSKSILMNCAGQER